jgi:hypothetical protein
MACEISVESALLRAFEEKGIGYLEESVLEFLSGYNLATKRIRQLYIALTGKQPQDQPFWPDFKTSAARRNQAVHNRGVVTKADAEASYGAASALVAYMQ